MPAGEYGLSITQLMFERTDTAGGSYYSEWNGPVTKNTQVRFAVSVSVPADAANIDTLVLDIKTDNITITSGEEHRGSFAAGTAYCLMYEGYVTSTGSAAVTATLASGRGFVDGKFKFTYKNTAYTVTHGTDYYDVATAAEAVRFSVAADGKITSISVDGTTVMLTLDGATNLTSAQTATLETVFAALGFKLDGQLGYMYEAGFTAMYGDRMQRAVTAKYDAGATVYAPTVEPPQTGDAGTLTGYIMILAALAAAAFIRKKASGR